MWWIQIFSRHWDDNDDDDKTTTMTSVGEKGQQKCSHTFDHTLERWDVRVCALFSCVQYINCTSQCYTYEEITEKNVDNNNNTRQRVRTKTKQNKNNEQKYITGWYFQKKKCRTNFSRAFEYARQCDNKKRHFLKSTFISILPILNMVAQCWTEHMPEPSSHAMSSQKPKRWTHVIEINKNPRKTNRLMVHIYIW